MGFLIFDQFSLLHFASGVLAYFFGITFWQWFMIHIVFEYTENNTRLLNILKSIPWWPGGKEGPDAFINSVGDQISSMIGWVVAKKLDELGKINEWHRVVKQEKA